MFKTPATLIAAVVLLSLPLVAQTPATSAPAAKTAPNAEQPAAPSGYTYNAEGRRDPFVSLIGRGSDPSGTVTHASGIPGLLVDEVTVKGVIRGTAGYLAMVQASDNKTYIIRSGDRLADGSVKAISQDGVVFSQNVQDPLALVKQREVSKPVRAGNGRG